jgi:hypothetical protein
VPEHGAWPSVARCRTATPPGQPATPPSVAGNGTATVRPGCGVGRVSRDAVVRTRHRHPRRRRPRPLTADAVAWTWTAVAGWRHRCCVIAALLTVAALVAAASNTPSVAGHAARARAAASHLADPARRRLRFPVGTGRREWGIAAVVSITWSSAAALGGWRLVTLLVLLALLEGGDLVVVASDEALPAGGGVGPPKPGRPSASTGPAATRPPWSSTSPPSPSRPTPAPCAN